MTLQRNLFWFLVAALMAGLILVAPAQPARAQAMSSCQKVMEYVDLDADGQPEALTLACQFTPGAEDRMTLYKQPGSVVPDVPWQQNIAYEEETWVFDHGAQGKASLIIIFRRDGTALVAYLYDDRDQDGKVGYEIDNGRVVVTEGNYWTARVVAPDGWWIRDGVLNYNLYITVDGDVEGMFMAEAYRNRLVTDGRPDYDINFFYRFQI